MTYPRPSQTAPTPPGAVSARSDRVVHASRVTPEGCRVEVVRYDVQGRWYMEWDQPPGQRTRLKSVADAVSQAIAIEAEGGTIHTGRSGGTQFDAKVAGARRKRS